jgi:hypothetical protein
MALAPALNDIEGQAALKSGTYNSGASAPTTNPMTSRVMVIAAARFGLTNFETGKIGNICASALTAAGGDPQKVDYAGMRPALVKLLGPL